MEGGERGIEGERGRARETRGGEGERGGERGGEGEGEGEEGGRGEGQRGRETDIKRGAPTRRLQQDERRGGEQPCGVAGVDGGGGIVASVGSQQRLLGRAHRHGDADAEDGEQQEDGEALLHHGWCFVNEAHGVLWLVVKGVQLVVEVGACRRSMEGRGGLVGGQ